MPNGDGLRAASEIREKLPETPIVIFTLFKSGELESLAKQVGVRAVISKEEGVVKLLHTIEEELGLPSSF
jgi:DNA-binding NarL/FixJ family response regulator